MVHGGDEESAGTAGRVEDQVLVGGVEHPDHHVADVTRGEELAPVAAEVGAYNLLVGLALDVDVGVEEREHLELGNDVGQNLRLQLDLFVGLEDLGVLLLDAGEELADAAGAAHQTGDVLAFLGSGVELRRA
ncbi:Uncharacterised protein [Chlamydia trachomatis]|nr:Uncharacterised protein [Chlamydia trachomatis]